MYKLFVLIFLCAIPNISIAETPSVNNLPDALALSEDSGMPILLVFSRAGCSHCDDLKKDIKNGLFNEELNGYILCYIDTINNKELTKEYRVSGIPDSRIIKKTKETSRIVGYIQRKYRKWLNDARK